MWRFLTVPCWATPPSVDAPPVSGAKNGSDHAVVISNERYQDFGAVAYASRDAEAFASWLTRTRGVPAVNVVRVSEASRRGIVDAVTRVAADTPPDGTLWVYYAGHGLGLQLAGREASERVLVGINAIARSDELADYVVPLSDLRGIAEGSKAGQAVLVIDACFNNVGRDGAPLVDGRFAVPVSTLASVGKVVVWSATDANQTAAPYPATQHGAFTYFAVGALSGWADGVEGTPDRQVTLQEAHTYVTRAMSSAGILGQLPVLAGTGSWVAARGALVPPPDAAFDVVTAQGTGAGSRFTNTTLRVDAELRSQQCTDDARSQVAIERERQLKEVSDRTRAEGLAAWDALERQASACTELQSRSTREECARAVEEWIRTAETASVTLPATTASAPTSCGALEVVDGSRSRRVDFSTPIAEALELMRRLEFGPAVLAGEADPGRRVEAIPLPPLPSGLPEAVEKGIRAWESGDPATAAASLTGPEQPVSVHEQARSYYRGRALRDLGQIQAAQAAFMSVVRRGVTAIYFPHALHELSRIGWESGDATEVLRIVTKIPPEVFPAPARDHLIYLLAAKDLERTREPTPLTLVASIEPSAPEYLSAQFLEGELLRRAGSFSSARDRFLKVARAKPSGQSYLQLSRAELRRDHALLALARTYSDVGKLERTRDLLARMPSSSPLFGQAKFEEAWARFLLSDRRGAESALDAAARTGSWQPGRDVLRALVAFDSCSWPEAGAALDAASAELVPVSATLRAFLATYPEGSTQDQLRDAYLALLGPDPSVVVPDGLLDEFGRDGELTGLRATLARIGAEERAVDAHVSSWGDTLATDLRATLKEERARWERRAGARALKLVKRHQDAIAEALTQVDLLAVELINARRPGYAFHGAGCPAGP